MFRELTRKNRAISDAECIELLKNEPRGVLSVSGDDGYPYGLPINFWYDEDSGHIFFHGGKAGHRVDAVRRNDKVSFCVYDKGFIREGEWALNIKSVIIFGRLKEVTDHDRAMEVSRLLSLKFTQDKEYIDKEIEKYGEGTLCYELIPEYMTGKLVKES